MSIATFELENRSSVVRVKKIEDTSDFLALKERWQNLLSQSRSNSIFLTWDWLYTWWMVYKENRKLFILIVEDEQENLLGIAPLIYSKKRLICGTYRVLEFLGTGEKKRDKVCSEFLDFIVHKDKQEDVIRVIFNYLLEQSCNWDIINLESIEENSFIMGYLPLEQLPKKFILRKDLTIEGGYNYCFLPETWEEYLRASKSGKRKKINRARRNIAKLGKVNAYLSQEQTLEDDLEEFIQLHQLRWNSAGRRGCFSSQKFTSFHKKIAHIFIKNGWFGLLCLKVNDQLEGCEYSFIYNHRLFVYQSGYNPTLLKKLTLGTVTMTYLIENAIARGVRMIHFLRGEGKHKDMWGKDKRQVYRLIIAPKGIKGNLYILERRAVEKVKQVIKGIIKNIQIK